LTRLLFKKHDVSETAFFLRLQVDPTQMDPIKELVCLLAPVT
jgi:hypothetical protein